VVGNGTRQKAASRTKRKDEIMPKVIINDVELEAQEGENLLMLARRHGLHVGFICDGRGICPVCECRVLSGGEMLTPVNKVEQRLMTPEQIEDGYRVACMTKVQGSGTLKIVARVEEMRRDASGVFNPPEGTNTGENLGRLLNNLLTLWLDQGRFVASVLPIIPRQFAAMPPHIEGISQYGRDTLRVIGRTAFNQEPEEPKQLEG
jgi:ferredoxin